MDSTTTTTTSSVYTTLRKQCEKLLKTNPLFNNLLQTAHAFLYVLERKELKEEVDNKYASFVTEIEKMEQKRKDCNMLETGFEKDFKDILDGFELDFGKLYKRMKTCQQKAAAEKKKPYRACLGTTDNGCSEELKDRMQIYLALLSSTNLYWFITNDNSLKIPPIHLKSFCENENFDPENVDEIVAQVIKDIKQSFNTTITYYTDPSCMLPMFRPSDNSKVRYLLPECFKNIYQIIEKRINDIECRS